MSLDTAEQRITVEPWGADAKSCHQNGQVWPYQATAAAQNCLIRQPWMLAFLRHQRLMCS